MTAALIVIAFILGFAAIHIAQPFLAPVVAGTLLALVMAPIAAFFEKYLRNATISALVTALLCFGGVAALCLVIISHSSSFTGQLEKVGPQLERRLQLFEHDLRSKFRDISKRIPLYRSRAPNVAAAQAPPVQGVAAVIKSVQDSQGPGPIAIMVSGAIGMIIPSLGPALLQLLLVLLLSTIFLIFRHSICDRYLVLGGHERREETLARINENASRLGRYLMAFTFANISFGLLVGISFLILGVPWPFMLGLTLALLRFVPFLGVPIGSLTVFLFLFATSDTWTDYVLPVSAIVAIDLALNNLAEPMLYSRSCNIHPVIVILSAFFWGWLWGPIGFVLSTPITISVLIFSGHFPSLAPYMLLATNAPPEEAVAEIGEKSIIAADDAQ